MYSWCSGWRPLPESLLEIFKLFESFHVSFYEHSMNTSCVGLHVLYDLIDGNCGPKEPYKSLSNKLPRPSGCKSLHHRIFNYSATGSMAVVLLKFTLSMAYHGLSWLWHGSTCGSFFGIWFCLSSWEQEAVRWNPKSDDITSCPTWNSATSNDS